jgi:hypothetical protein
MALRLEIKKSNLPKKKSDFLTIPHYIKIELILHKTFSKTKDLFSINMQKQKPIDKLIFYDYPLSTFKMFNHQKCALVGTWLI